MSGLARNNLPSKFRVFMSMSFEAIFSLLWREEMTRETTVCKVTFCSPLTKLREVMFSALFICLSQ